VILAILLVASTPTPTTAPQAAAPAPQAQTAAQTTTAEPPRRTCRMVRVTGSRLGGQRVCRTEAERDTSVENNQNTAREMQRDSGGNVDLIDPGA
jgi:hypothetical protein